MEEVVSFKNRTGHTLYGILHVPDVVPQEPKIGVNLLNPGLKNRVAPNRLNVKIARTLCKNGIYVLRFDPAGIGDSEGEFKGNNESMMHLWNRIQKGAFVEDTICSNDYFSTKTNIHRFIMIGQCGGGVTAGLTSIKDERVDGLILIDTPFRIIQYGQDSVQLIVESFSLKSYLVEHINDLMTFRFLAKIRSGSVDWKYFTDKLKHINRLLLQQAQKTGGQIHERFHYSLGESLIRFLDHKKIQFIFAENDFSLREFETDFKCNFLNNTDIQRTNYAINVIENANHIYTENKCQKELVKIIISCFENKLNSSIPHFLLV